MSVLKIGIAGLVALGLWIGLSSIHPWGNLRSSQTSRQVLLAGSNVPPDVRQTLQSKCADCHSANTSWPPYSKLAPASWLVERDVHDGREHFDMSRWQQYTVDAQVDLLAKLASESRTGQMPLKHYLLIHPQARLSSQEQEHIYSWAKAERKRLKQELAARQQYHAQMKGEVTLP